MPRQCTSERTERERRQLDPRLDLLSRLQRDRRDGRPVPERVRQAVEVLLGAPLGDVRLHSGDDARAAADRVDARAMAVGRDVYLAGSVDTSSREGFWLLAHEVTHAAQAPARTDTAPLHLGGTHTAAERQADHLADLATGQAFDGLAPTTQARAPMAALAPGAVARKGKHKDTPTVHQSASAIEAMKLSDAHRYAEKQVDWANNKALSSSERNAIWKWVHFARESDGNLAGCGDFTITDLHSKVTSTADLEALKEYGQALSATAPGVSLEKPASTVAEAVKWGSALEKLHTTPGPIVMKQIANQANFELLVGTAGGVAKMIDYIKVCTPLLHAEAGAELKSIVTMLNEKTDYKKMHQALPEIRSLHRFQKVALTQLATNKKVKGNKKPFVLVLHSSLDHNGAFHHDPELTKLITNTKNLTLMIEGAKKLSDVTGQIGPLAKKYGANGKIDQVMFAGHGNSTSIELAGDAPVVGGKVAYQSDDVRVKDPASDKLFAAILANMDHKKGHHRVVFNACLTNSNNVEPSAITKSSSGGAQKEVKKYIRNNPSITTYLKRKNPKIDVRGANGSIFQVELIDPATGKLVIKDADDQYAMGTKIEYIEHGTEAGGVMRALVEAYAHNRKKAMKAVKKRLATPVGRTALHEEVIAILFQIISKPPNDKNLKLMAKLAPAGEEIPMLIYKSHCRVHTITGTNMPKKYVIPILGHMLTRLNWSSMMRVPLVIHQALFGHRKNAPRDVINTLSDASLNCQTSRDFVDFSVVSAKLGAMMKIKTPALLRGRTLLALLAIATGKANGAAKKLIRDLAKKHSKRLPAFARTLLAGLASEDKILVAVGVKRASGSKKAPPRIKAPVPDANVDFDGDKKNESWVEPMSAKATLLGPGSWKLYTSPTGGKTIKTVKAPKDVQVVGKYKNAWYALQLADGTIGYVMSGAVHIKP